MAKAKNSHIGSSLDALLETTGELAEVDAIAIKRVIAWQVREKMETENITKVEMAKRMKTSRSALDRLLNPENTSVTLNTLDSAARAIGRRLRIELV